MHPELIRAELKVRFGTVKAFETAKDLPADSVRDVLRGRSVLKTANAIAEAIGKPMSTLFPGRFDYVERYTTSRKRDAHRLNADAA